MAVSFATQAVVSGLSNPTTLQFGPDGRLYVAQQDGFIKIYDVTQPVPGQWSAVAAQTLSLIKSIPNHNDDGSPNTSITDRQVTGILVAGTAANPEIYVTSSDPRIANSGDLNLDTNSGILSRLTWNGASWTKVDLFRGLPRSEENHSPNGMVLSVDGTKLYLAQGGNTNNGAPSNFFSNTPEYALTAAVLEIDLVALEAIPNKVFTYAPGVTSTYKYDLPTLDDPTAPNNGATGNETAGGLDVGGPFGGNDGLNQAILPADAPLRIFATGLRNAFDAVLTESGKLFTVDNGSNFDLGGAPILDANGKPTNQFNNGGTGNPDSLYLLTNGSYYGHPDPTRGNQTGSVLSYADGSQPQVIATIPNAAAAVPSGVQIAPGFVIDPSKFTSSAARLAQEGQFTAGQQSLVQFGSSTNGLMEYTATSFNGAIKGALITASFDGTLKLIQLAPDGVTVQGVTTLATPGGTPLDLVQGPGGSIWVAQIGAGQILALTPSDQASASDPDMDHDGLLNTADPFQADAANGLGTFLASNASLNWNFQFGAGDSAPGPDGLFLGLTGHMANGTRDFVVPVAEGGLDLTNVKIGTAAGGGLVVVEEVSTGTASGSANTGEFVFQTGVALAPDVQTFNVKWTAINPFPGLPTAPTVREIGGFIGTGDQSSFLKVVAGPNGMLFQLESNGAVTASQTLNAPGVGTAPASSNLVFELLVNRATSQATPSVTYTGSSGPVKVTGNAINLAGTSILTAINGDYTVQGKDSGLAVGLWSSNTGEGSQNTFQASFDDILITSTGPAGQLVTAVNVGGGQVTASNGVVFQADAGPTTGSSLVFSTGLGIAGTTDDALYQNERWTPGGSYTYEVPVANGTYQVDLLMAEIYAGITGPGQRVFDMSLEGQALAALQNIDIYANVGANAAYTISQQVTVNDGSLSIQVGPGSSSPGNVENAKLNAFAVYTPGATLPPSPTLAISAVNASQNEGNSGSTAFTFTVSRTGSTTGASTVGYAVTGSSANPATAGDFTGSAFPTGTVSFAAGETGKTITVNVAGDSTVEPNEGFTVTLSNPSSGTTIGTATATGTIVNDDAAVGPSLSIAAASASLNEGNSGSTAFTFTVSRTGSTTGASTVGYAVTGSSANPATAGDFTGSAFPTGTVSFAAGETGKTITVNVAGDSTVEPNEGFTVTLSNPSSGTTIGTATATGTIVNDDAAVGPSLSIAAASASLNEGNSGSTAFTFTVSRTGSTTGASTVGYAVTGSSANPATAGDFTGAAFPTGTVSFAAGETSKTITVNVAADTTVEPNEGFTVTLSNPSSGTTIGTATATGTILNDDGAVTPTLVAAVNVGGGQVTASNGVVFQADAGPTTGSSLVFSTGLGIAGTTDDALYQNERWTPGGSYTYEVPVANGTYQVDLLMAEIYAGITGPGQRVFDMSLEGQALAALQNIDIYANVGANAAYTISQQVTVNDGSLSIQVGPGSSSPGNVENAKLNAFAVYSTAAPTSPTLSIAAANASLNEGDSGSTAFTFTVSRTGSTTGASTVGYAVTGSSANPATAGDFTGSAFPTGTVSFAAGETGKTITVNVAGDSTVEPNEGFTVTLSNPSSGTTIGTATATGTIVNDDAAVGPSLSIAAASASLNEGNSGSTAFTFTVSRTGSTTGASTVGYAVTGSSANPATAGDFTGSAFPTGTVSFAAGETGKTITVNVAGDSTVEPNEGFTVTLSNPSSGTTIGTATATGTIVNDDAAVGPSLSIAAASASLNEGNSGSTAFTFTVSRTGSTTGASTVGYAVTGSSANPATAGDFTGAAFPTGTVSFAAGETSKTITVNVAADTTVEPNEGFTVTLSNPSSGTTIGTATATGTILNDDGAVTPTLVAAVNVGGGQVTASNGVVFQADAGPTTGSSLVFSTGLGIAGTTDDALYQNERWTPGGSYTYEVPVANGTYQVDLLMAEIYAGITGPGQRVFDMSLEGQALAALQNIDIYANVGANAAYTISQQVTVNDGSLSIQVGPGSSSPGNVENAKLNAFAVYSTAAPTSPTLSIAAANASLNEGDSGSTAFTFTVSRTGSTTGASTVGYAVTGSSANPATAGDFTGSAFPTGTVSFAAGETGKTITVNVAGDSTVEPNEGFTVTLSNPSSGTTIGTATATGTIVNDDAAVGPSLSIAAASASLNEGNSGSTAFTFTVSRTGSTTGASTVGYAVTGSSANPATAGDFTGSAFPTGTVSFAAGETSKTITVNVAADTTVEPNEGFTVTLSNPSSGTTIGTAAATGTIVNDDSGGGGASARLLITPGGGLNASTYNEPSYELTNTGTTAIRTLTIDLHNSLITGTVFDPIGTFGDTTALDFTPYGSVPVSATWAYGPNPVTEGGYKTLAVTFGGAGLAAGQTFAFRLDADPASIEGPSPGPNESGSISGFEHIGASVTVGTVDGGSIGGEVFTQGSAGGGMATLSSSLLAAPVLSMSTVGGTPLVTDAVGGILKANLPGLNAGAGSPGNDVVVEISGTAGQTVRLAVSEIGGVGMDIPLGSHEGNTILQNPSFVDVTLGAGGTASVALALPGETPTSSLAAGSVSGRFAVTAAAVDTATGAAISQVSSTLVVKDAANSFTSDTASDTFIFRQGFATTDVFQFSATGGSHDFIGLDQDLFPGMTMQQVLNSNALQPGAGAGDVDIVPAAGGEVHLHDSSGQLTVDVLRANPQDFFFV